MGRSAKGGVGGLYLLEVVWALAAFGLIRLLGSVTRAASLTQDLALVAGLVIAGWAGRRARGGGRRGWAAGLGAGAVYGLVNGLASALWPVPAAVLRRHLLKLHEPPAVVAESVHVLTSTTGRLAGILLAVLVAAFLGIVAGILGGLTAPPKEDQRAV